MIKLLKCKIKTGLTDGLYQVKTSYLCAGFEVYNGYILLCAPILLKKITYWQKIAVRIGDNHDPCNI